MTIFTSQPLSILGLILVVGYFAGRAANFLRLPRISGYIVTGLLFSPSISGLISFQQIDLLFNFTSEIALAFIAYSIGGSLKMSRVRGLGKEILWINLAEGSGAFICTCLAIYATASFLPPFISENHKTFISVILILGGISVATAPAATMAVLHELRAKGPLTTTLLGVVALDDALSIVIFTGAITIASQLLSGSVDSSLLGQGFMTIAGASALLGIILLVGRFLGKLGGTLLGGRISRTPALIYIHLGPALLPQAGLSLGLIFLAKPILPVEIFDTILSALLVSIIINEFISPPLVKWAITKAGESNPVR